MHQRQWRTHVIREFFTGVAQGLNLGLRWGIGNGQTTNFAIGVPAALDCPFDDSDVAFYRTGPNNAILTRVIGWAPRAKAPGSSLRSMAGVSAPGPN
jgi:hypothetical protein